MNTLSPLKKLILIDGNAIIHRAYHALPHTISNSQGELLNAVYGFASMLITILANEKPECIAVSFDMKGKTFRHEEYKDYKATRLKAADELYAQIPRIRELVSAFGIPIYEVQGYEADDVLGTLARQAEAKNVETYIVTGDMDALQLVTPRVKVLAPIKGFNTTMIYDEAAVQEKYNLSPTQITDLKGLQGDSSDNIKGVPGIGPKTAKTLLQTYGSIENIYEHLPEITGKVHDHLENGRESAFFSKKLATIITEVPVALDLTACTTHDYDLHKIRELFQELEFRSLFARITNLDRYYAEKKVQASEIQPTLF